MDFKFRNHLILLIVIFVGGVQAKECDNFKASNQIHVIDKGTFMLSLDKGNANVSSYLPSGTMVKTIRKQTINHHKRANRPPIPKCYLKVQTNLGKIGFVLQESLSSSSLFNGEYLFPRTEIVIYKRPNLEKVTSYRNGDDTLKNDVFMSSTNPKITEKLKVIGMDSGQDFYIVKSNFLGEKVRGYVFADDIERGKAALVNPQETVFVDRKINQVSSNVKEIFNALLSDKVNKELDVILDDFAHDAILEVCKVPLSVTPSVEIKADTLWISGAVKIEGKIILKAKERSFSHESYTIVKGNREDKIEFMKHLTCDSESMLFPVVVKIKQGKLVLRRDGFKNLGAIFRKKEDPIADQQFKTMLTIKSYGDWYSVFSHLDNNLQDWKAIYGDNYDVLIDILIDSISYFPPSQKRVIASI